MAERPNVIFCGRSLAEIAGLNPAGSMNVSLSLVVVCCQVQASATVSDEDMRPIAYWTAGLNLIGGMDVSLL